MEKIATTHYNILGHFYVVMYYGLRCMIISKPKVEYFKHSRIMRFQRELKGRKELEGVGI